MTEFVSFLRKSLASLDRYPAFLLASWLVVSISLPLVKRVFGMQTLWQGLSLAILLQVLFVLHVLFHAWGWWRLLRVASAIVLLTWAAQAISLRSGYPFGNMRYDQLIQPQVMGVPILVPLIWLMLLPPAWAVAKLITRKVSGCMMRPAFIAISALAITACDIYLDPLMVRLGFWQWTSSGGLFGIPWINFGGWIVVAGILTFAISPKHLPSGLLVLVYALIWAVWFIALLFFGKLLFPALVGFCLMGAMLLWAGKNVK